MVIPFTNFILALLAVEVTIPLIDLETMMPVLMGMLGLGAMRSYEKPKAYRGKVNVIPYRTRSGSTPL